MAEEWVAKYVGLSTEELRTIQPYILRVRTEDYKEAFLAGLKAGRPHWHDLQKDKNDLPENKRNVWCDYGDGYGKGFYDKDEGGWWIEGHMFYSIIDAWCEIPTFDKE